MNDYVISPDIKESTSFIHGNSLIVGMDRQDFEATIESELLRLPYSDIALFLSFLSFICSADNITIGCFILVNDGNSLCGLLQATSTAKNYVGKAVHSSTLAIEVNVRVWYRFHSLPYRRVPIHLNASTRCWISKKTMTAIMGEFLHDSGPIDYPVMTIVENN